MPWRLFVICALALLAACGKRTDPRAVAPGTEVATGSETAKPKPKPADARIDGQSLQDWYKAATADDAKARARAVRAAKGLAKHPKADDIAGLVLGRLEDKDEAVRKEALAVLPTLGKAAADRIAAGWGSLPAPSPQKAAAMFAALRAMGPYEMPALVAAVRHDLWRISRTAADRLVAFKGDAIEPLAAALADGKGFFKDKLNMPAAALAEIGPPAVPALLTAARDDKRREGAILALRKMGRPGVEALTALSKEGGGVAARAGIALASLRPGGGEVEKKAAKDNRPDVPALVQQLDGDQRVAALQQLGRHGPFAAPATEKVAAIAADGKLPPVTRAEALACLARVGPAAQKALPTLRTIVRRTGEPEELRGLAAVAIAAHGPGAKAAVGDLIKLLESPGKTMRRWQRFSALHALGRIGPEARPATPAVVNAIEHRYDQDFGPWPALAGVAMQTLAAIGPAALEAAGPLRRFADADNKDRKLSPWRFEATAALLAIDPGPASVARARKLLPGGGAKLTRALWAADEESRPAVVARVREIIDAGEPFRGAEAMDLLAGWGPGAAAAVPSVVTQYQYSGTLSAPSAENPLFTGFGSYGDGPDLRPSRALVDDLYPPRQVDMNRSLLRCLGSIGRGSAMAEAFLEHVAWFVFDVEHRRMAREELGRIAPGKATGLPIDRPPPAKK